jgi:NTE family protein
MPKVSVALQGGGSHGAFTWGVLDRLLEAIDEGRFEIAAISGSSAGAINAAVAACGLIEGGPALARTRLREFWRLISERGAQAGNALFGFADPGPFGPNIDWSPGAIALEALGLVFSPYSNPFYRDPLGPLLQKVLPKQRLALLNAAASPRVFVTTVNVGTDLRRTFTQPEVTIDTLRASACLPSEFRAVQIGADYFWDGGYLGNPALEPLLNEADDLLLVLVNPLTRKDGIPPRSARAILDRLNQITFNASVVLEMNGIAAINSLLQELRDKGIDYEGSYRTINLHLIRDDAFMARLGFVSKSSTSWPLLEELHAAGYKAADLFLREEGDAIGQRSSADVKQALIRPMLKN